MTKTSVVPCSALRALRALAVVGLILCVVPADAQKGGSHPPTPPPTPSPPKISPQPSSFDQNKLILESNNLASPKIAKDNNCFLPPLDRVQSTTVEVGDLQIPAKAKKEYEDSCAALKNKKMADAENHLRKAVKQYPKYSAAWVMLGQVLETQQKANEAREACSQPVSTDPNYLPAYLCLADISAHLEHWDEVLKASTRALELDPTTDELGYTYNAAANLNLHNLPQAEKSALRASEIDKGNADPRIHFLLAQIYEAKGNRAEEAAQLKEYLKYTSDPADVAMVKSYLAELEK